MNSANRNTVQPNSPPPALGEWLVVIVLALWLAMVPLATMFALTALNQGPPTILVQLGLLQPGNPILPEGVLGLLAIGLTLGLHLSVFIPAYAIARRYSRKFLKTVTILLVAIALYQMLDAVAKLPSLANGGIHPPSIWTLTAVLRLVLVLPYLLLGVAALEARRQGSSLIVAWRRVGLRLWLNPSSVWLALGVAAVIVFPWVLVGSLGSKSTSAASLIQALPNAVNEEILFRGIAFAWLWRAARGRGGGAAGCLLLFVAAQGGSVLPGGDLEALPRFVSALLVGLLFTELTIRAGGSIWLAVVVHFLYDWFPLAFVDPRSREEVLHWLVRIWMPLSAGGLGLILWLSRRVGESAKTERSLRQDRGGWVRSASFACLAWVCVLVLYLTLGVPGFHPDGFLVFLEEQADLEPAAAIADPAERRAWVYESLVEVAERSQSPIRADLDRRSVPYRAHYLVNVIEVLDRPSLRHSFVGQPGVASVMFQPGMRRYPRTFGIPDLGSNDPQGVEWNVREVGADRVWDLGYVGEGIVVGDADTGVAWDHPALKNAYLGWDGNVATHDYHWYDPWDGHAEPWDDNGHGTHTTGTVVGQDGENQVGVAPGSQWIACRNMRHGLGNPGSYLSCMEFLLAPFPQDGDPFQDGDPARGAHVVNNSWGCPSEEGCLPGTLQLAADHLRAAGQMMVVSAGNEGPSCGTVQDPPAIYDSVYSVGASTQSDRAAQFSSRGPVIVDGSHRAKPDIVAPGVDIRSSVPGGYASFPGTSMAGPHVAGVVALLWSADPDLVGDVEATETILSQTAEPLTADAVCAAGTAAQDTICTCGSDDVETVPNQVYGWGQVDAWAAVQAILDRP